MDFALTYTELYMLYIILNIFLSPSFVYIIHAIIGSTAQYTSIIEIVYIANQ